MALRTRLLHPGVATHAILVYYVNIVYALRLVDTSGVVLSQVLPPVQRYLRTRSDTIQAVVAALLGNDPAFQLLRMELESAGSGRQPALSKTMRRAQEEDEVQARPEYWSDPAWAPRPVDAGPEYSQMRSRDVIDLLVGIFDDHAGFIHALERHTAQQLMHTQDYDTARVRRNNDIFKQRFGEGSLHHCDVMLADVAASARADAQFHRGAERAGVYGAVHPLFISRQFWPEIETGTFAVPARLAQALEAFAAFYADTQRQKRLRWLPHLGTVDLAVEMGDGRTVEVTATPLQAAVAELVAGEHDARIVSADHIAGALDIDRQAAVHALRFWVSHHVLSELPQGGSFAVRERI
ncbi:hypothetical protein MVES1_001950 [Malassezia vespertilionis]|uniref:uncharacterized protein n=1 Tax=Malassezia vespertilionis TaxID=2020962 RepID=UPI0024B1D47F|nr:uncharacterized protein MVES1_001950 [Malassezia vespertilionis]WFD06597.1 hypothetical protein MVES1_001950 [Malassezia vespertilionis]